jgi:glutaredoxin-related protein
MQPMTELVKQPMTELILYSKPGCGLCDKAKALLDSAKLEYIEINILENKEGMALYAFEIPVLVDSSGKELLKGGFTESNVAALLMRL